MRERTCPPSQHLNRSPTPSQGHGGGTPVKPLRCIWNAGHLGNQPWTEVLDWLRTEAKDSCDILILQETHWTASAQDTVQGWTCVSSSNVSAKAGIDPKPKRGRKPKQPVKPQQPTEDCSPEIFTTEPDGVMVLSSPHIDARQAGWREQKVGRLLEVRFVLGGCPFCASVWSTAKTPAESPRQGYALGSTI